jgi:hypothetical protein
MYLFLPKICWAAYILGDLIRNSSGANLTVVSYETTSSLVRFEIKNIFFRLVKRSSVLQRWHCKFRSRRIGSRYTDMQATSYQMIEV